MPLTAKDFENAPPKNKSYRLTEGRSLYIEVRPKNSKYGATNAALKVTRSF